MKNEIANDSKNKFYPIFRYKEIKWCQVGLNLGEWMYPSDAAQDVNLVGFHEDFIENSVFQKG